MRTIALVVTVACALAVWGCSATTVDVEPMVVLQPMPADSDVYLFVMDTRPPACPWEVIGTVRATPGWRAQEQDREAVFTAVREIGGQGVLLSSGDDAEGEVIRFLDPIRLCDPNSPPAAPGGSSG